MTPSPPIFSSSSSSSFTSSSSSSSRSLLSFWLLLLLGSSCLLFHAPLVSADFPVTVICERAPWPVRIQPAWQSISTSIRAYIPALQRELVFLPGSLILYGGIGSNDIWITQVGSRSGRDWYLIGGIARNPYAEGLPVIASAPSPFDLTSFTPRYVPAVCEDPTNDRAYIIGGQQPNGDALSDVWATDDGRTWIQETQGEFPERSWSSCSVNSLEHIILTGGIGQPYQTPYGRLALEFNDVWRSTTHGMSWSLMSGRAPWGARYEMLFLTASMPVASSDVLYVMGGKHDRLGENDGYYNDVWVSSDDGVTWALLTMHAPWAARWGHSGVVTRDGVLVFFGGGVKDEYYADSEQSYAYWGDIWASFDGGYTWSECSNGRGSYNRTEAAVTLDSDGYFMIAAGYSIRQPRGHNDVAVLNWNNDVVRSEFSLERDEMSQLDGGRLFAEKCGVRYPTNGPGLKLWPVPQYNAAKGAIVGVTLLLVLVTFSLLSYCWVSHVVKKYGEWRWPTGPMLSSLAVNALPEWIPLPLSLDKLRVNHTVAASADADSNSLTDTLLADSAEGQPSTASSSASPSHV